MTGLGHDRGLGVQANVGDCFLQFRYVIAEPAESSVAPCTKCPSHLFRSVVMVNHQKPLPLLLWSRDLSTESTAPVLFSAKLGVLGQANSVNLPRPQIVRTIPAGVIQPTTTDFSELIAGKKPLAKATYLFVLAHPGKARTNFGMFLESMVDNRFPAPATGDLRPSAIEWVSSLRASGRVAQYVTRHEPLPAPTAGAEYRRTPHYFSRLKVSRTARRTASASFTRQRSASFSRFSRSSLERFTSNCRSLGCIYFKYRSDHRKSQPLFRGKGESV